MEDEKFEKHRESAWRNSEFYDWVIGVIKEEVNANYVKESIVLRSSTGDPMTNDEIGEAMRAEVQASLRIQAILDKLE
jgi:hypothetical protein